MSGQAAIRGFLIQTLIGLLRAVSSDGEFESWSTVELEPNEAGETVDIRWQTDDGVILEQVKSSQNAFKLSQICKWVNDLVSEEPIAHRYYLTLIGPCTIDVTHLSSMTCGAGSQDTKLAERLLKDFHGSIKSSVEKLRVPPPQPMNISTLMECASGCLEQFLELVGEEIPKRAWRLKIVEGLCTKLLTHSTQGSTMLREELERLLTTWIKGIRSEQLLFERPDFRLIPYLSFFEREDKKIVLLLSIKSVGQKTCFNVSGRWAAIGQYAPTEHDQIGRRSHLNPFPRSLNGKIHSIDPGATQDLVVRAIFGNWQEARQRIEVEVGGLDIPRQLFYWHDPLFERTKGKELKDVEMIPYELSSPVRPMYFEEYYPVFGKQTKWGIRSNGNGEIEAHYQFDPPEKF